MKTKEQTTLLRFLPPKIGFSWKYFRFKAQKMRKKLKKGKR